MQSHAWADGTTGARCGMGYEGATCELMADRGLDHARRFCVDSGRCGSVPIYPCRQLPGWKP